MHSRGRRDLLIDTVPQISEDRGPRRRGAPVMADVAIVAGVSHMTVSRVLNEPGSVKPETRDRVQAAMRSLGYRPNSVARALASPGSDSVGGIGVDAAWVRVKMTV